MMDEKNEVFRIPTLGYLPLVYVTLFSASIFGLLLSVHLLLSLPDEDNIVSTALLYFVILLSFVIYW